jgi:hypothetical protein
MISKQLETINRRTRILKAIAAGHSYGYIASRETVTHQCVSQIAIKAGIRKLPQRTKAK